MMRTFEKISNNGISRIEVTRHYFRQYLDGQFLRRGLIGEINTFIEDLYGAEYHEV